MKITTNDFFNTLLSSWKRRGALKTAFRFIQKAFYGCLSLPSYITIEISSRCNLNCPYCAASRDLMSDPAKDMTYSQFTKIIDELTIVPFYNPVIQLAMRGEPFMNKDAAKMITYASSRRFHVVVNSNGLLINESIARSILQSRLDCLVLSCDGASKETYEFHRKGGNFELFVNNMARLNKIRTELKRKHPFIELQFIVTKFNESEVPSILNLAKTLGADNLKFKSYKITCTGRDTSSIDKLREFLPSEERLSRYKIINNDFVPKKESGTCSWSGDCLVYCDGDIGPCCEDFDKANVIGNVFKEGFWALWNSPKYRLLRKRIKKRNLAICQSCS